MIPISAATRGYNLADGALNMIKGAADNFNAKSGTTGMSLGNKALHLSKNLNASSLIDQSSALRVEPLTVVGDDCLHLDYLPDVMQSLQSIVSGYYLQAVAVTANVGRVKVLRALDRLNPNRSAELLSTFAAESLKEKMKDFPQTEPAWRMASESYKWRLPTTKNIPAMEAEQRNSKFQMEKDTVSGINELSNLSVGKMISVTIKSGDEDMQIPIAIRLMVNRLSEKPLLALLTKEKDNSTTERYHAWRAGRLSFVKDLIMCQDLIDEQKKAMMYDRDGIYSRVIQQSNAHLAAGLTSGSPSLAAASNLIVFSEATAAKVELAYSGKLRSRSVREKIFNGTYAMILVMIDRGSERVTFFHRGIDSVTEVSVRDLKAGNKNNGPDVGDIMKAFQMGSSPSL